MKRITLCLVLLSMIVTTVPAFSQVGKDLSGPHFNLNIIGVSKDKTVPGKTDSNRHTIFVPLQSGGDVPRQVKIYYIAGDHFEVLDGNATDDNEATIMVPSVEYGDLCYDVYAVGLGKPNGIALVSADCAIDDLPDACQVALLLDSFTVERSKGKPKSVNISDVFRAEGCIDLDSDSACDTGDISFQNLWIFNVPQLVDYFWDYDNNGLKLMQTRFYPTTCGSIEFVQ
jgi:hypothetical protein